MNTYLGRMTVAACAMFAMAAGCDDGAEDGAGTLEFAIYGESFIEDGIPADEVVDGWEIEFESFLVVFSDVGAESEAKGALTQDSATYVVDLAKSSNGAGHSVSEAPVTSGQHYHLSYTIAPAAAGVTPSALNVEGADVTRMVDGGYSLWVTGQATRGNEVKTFAWGIKAATQYSDCHSSATLADGGRAKAEMTIHADHLFYDSLVSEEPELRFDLFASADSDNDGEITAAELAAVDITGEAKYQVGNQTDVQDLWAYVEAQTRTLGHVDGEGHCDTVK